MAKTDDIEAIIKLAKASGDIKLVKVAEDKSLDSTPSIAAVPDGVELRDLTDIIRAHQEFPKRAEGNVELSTIESFVNYVVRYGTANTVMFGDPEARHFESVMNYHRLPKDAFKNIVSDLEESVVEPDWCDWSATLTLKDFPSWSLFKSYTNRDLSLAELKKGLMAILPHIVSSNRVKDMREEYDPEDEGGVFPTFAAAELLHGVNCEGRSELVKLFHAMRRASSNVTTHLFQASMPMVVRKCVSPHWRSDGSSSLQGETTRPPTRIRLR